MVNVIEDESELMDEREQESPELKQAVHLEDPIEDLELRTPITVKADTSVLEAFKLMAEHDIGCLLVTDKKGKLKGIITERDLLRKACVKCEIMSDVHVEQFMTKNPESLRAEDPLAFALNRMCEYNFRHVPIIDRKNVAMGVVSMRDIVHEVGVCYQKEISNLPPKPVRRMRRRFAG